MSNFYKCFFAIEIYVPLKKISIICKMLNLNQIAFTRTSGKWSRHSLIRDLFGLKRSDHGLIYSGAVGSEALEPTIDSEANFSAQNLIRGNFKCTKVQS